MIDSNTIVGGRYRVVKPLGGGGMKMVYLAEDLRLSARSCALAEMVDSFTNPEMQQQAVAAFQREADMLAQLSNEHIPRVYDRFSDQNRHYLVMEFVDGVTLEDEMKAAGSKLAESRVVDIALQILDTLAYLHSLEPAVIYRDLKPSNVMLTTSEQVKLIDFGIARHFQPLSNATMIGTQGYAPPEQYRGRVEARSDLYALGATMHHALSGRDPTAEPPFSFPPLGKLRPEINPTLAALVDNALSYDVESRVPDALEFKRRLLGIKIERLTGGLVASSDAAEAIADAHRTARAQLKLPLGGQPRPQPANGQQRPAGAAEQVAAASAPTLLITPTEIPCPRCNRRIPPDSRFCSYCAADLRGAPAPAGPLEKTVILSQHPEPSLSRPRVSRPENSRRNDRTSRRRRHLPFAWLGVAFLIMALVRVLPSVIAAFSQGDAADRAADPPDPGVAPPSDSDSDFGTEPGDSSQAIRMVLLRQTLDGQGYRNVRFRVTGNHLDLWGTVASQAQRMMVENEAFMISGASSLNDHIRIDRAYAGP
jgi:serine/threonine protein kinase